MKVGNQSRTKVEIAKQCGKYTDLALGIQSRNSTVGVKSRDKKVGIRRKELNVGIKRLDLKCGFKVGIRNSVCLAMVHRTPKHWHF